MRIKQTANCFSDMRENWIKLLSEIAKLIEIKLCEKSDVIPTCIMFFFFFSKLSRKEEENTKDFVSNLTISSSDTGPMLRIKILVFTTVGTPKKMREKNYIT